MVARPRFQIVIISIAYSTVTAQDIGPRKFVTKCPLHKDASVSCGFSEELFLKELSPLCLSVTGFSSRDFEGDGIYCSVDENGVHSDDRLFYTAVHDALRYEIQSSKSGGQWVLLRVMKTRGKKWVGMPVYSATPTESHLHDWARNNAMNDTTLRNQTHTLATNLDWIGLTNLDGKLEIDLSEPRLSMETVDPPLPYFAAAWTLHQHRSNKMNHCTVAACDAYLKSANVTGDENNHVRTNELKLRSQIAEAIGNNVEAAKRYREAQGIVQKTMEEYATQHKPIPRVLRWKIAQLSLDIARSWTKALHIDFAIDAVTLGLANSPEQKQRRQLLIGLGDLKLMQGETSMAEKLYDQAKDSVRLKSGTIDRHSFLADAQRNGSSSIGIILTKLFQRTLREKAHVVKRSHDDDEKEQLGKESYQPSFAEVRSKILLQLNDGDEWDELLRSMKQHPWLNNGISPSSTNSTL